MAGRSTVFRSFFSGGGVLVALIDLESTSVFLRVVGGVLSRKK